MADFCKQCSMANFDTDTKDLAGMCNEGEIADALCEGCGLTLVDSKGRCVGLHEHSIEFVPTITENKVS